MKFLGASIFKSDGFRSFHYISVGFFFSYVKKSLEICCVKGKKKACSDEESSRRWGKKTKYIVGCGETGVNFFSR